MRSISDDDLCSDCLCCSYNPGHLSACLLDWPGYVPEFGPREGYVVSCKEFIPLTILRPVPGENDDRKHPL